LIVAMLSQGCAVSLGAVGAITGRGQPEVGGKLAEQLQFANSAGLSVGAQEQKSDHGWQALATAGYSKVPTYTSPAIGWEVVGLAGGGQLHVTDQVTKSGFLFGAQLKVPIRLTRGRELWQADDYVGTTWQLVPDAAVLGLLPLGEANCRVEYEVVLGLSLRFYLYTVMIP
jgi:hypothetical protein